MKSKIYEPVREFERATSYCPLYLAWRIVDEARDYFRTEIPESYARKLARRAEAVFAHHPSWAREATPRGPAGARQQFQCQRQREFILKFMRHWLAGVLARENPVLYRQLPESFKTGVELPEYRGRARSPLRAAGKASLARRARPVSPKSDEGGSDAPHHRFVHGCELLTV
jgi:hypothetical protein